MMFLSESMYGWGVYDLAMPRAVYHTLSDRRKWTTQIFFWDSQRRQRRTRRILDRRRQNVRQSILSIILGLLIHDVSWIQVLALSLVSLLCFGLIYMASRAIHEHPDRHVSMPVDIIVSVIEEKKTILVQEKIEQKPILELVVKAKPIEKPKPSSIQEEKIISKISSPNIRVIPEIKKRPKAIQPVALKNFSFDKTIQDEEIISNSDSVAPNRHYSINRVARKFRAKQPDFIPNSFSRQSDSPAVIISQANFSKKKYMIDTSNRRNFTPSDQTSGSNVFASSQAVKSINVILPETDQTNERYSSAKHGESYKLSPLFQSDNQSLSFTHQNEEHLILTPLTSVKSVSKKSRSIQSNSIAGEQAPDFLSVMAGEVKIDPSYLINLKKFSVCADPEEEFRLKTKLAASLDGPSKFSKNGIIFFFKYTETGYTVDIDIYNPQGELFQDRCSVLHLAIESIKNTKK